MEDKGTKQEFMVNNKPIERSEICNDDKQSFRDGLLCSYYISFRHSTFIFFEDFCTLLQIIMFTKKPQNFISKV